MRYLVEGNVTKRTECDCEWCKGHDEEEDIAIVVDALDIEEAVIMALKQSYSENWTDEPKVTIAVSAEIVRTPEQELRAFQEWQAAAKAWVT